ncbi:YybH family protein [Kineosporia mesophila]|uniref:YybH family protein n=1 Tax=Kineosporia mesophila TaxID=566012 RepID=UPI001E31D08A|nr:nuclear transport factor 2 family protein [Kineosporia mesophila]
MTIAILGATGQLVRRVVDSLLKAGTPPSSIRALGRDTTCLRADRPRSPNIHPHPASGRDRWTTNNLVSSPEPERKTMSETTTSARPLEKQIQERMLAWRDAFVSRDVDAIMSFYAPEGFTAFDLMPPFEFSGGPMWRRNWETFYTSFDGPIGLEIADLIIHASAELAIARCAVRMSGTMFGNPIDAWTRTTNCFALIEGQWLMIHDHVSWPIDFATGKALMDLTPVGAQS